MKKETILTVVVCVLVVVSVVGIPMGYFAGVSQREIVASNCGDVTCPDVPEVNVTIPAINTTVYWNNISNIYNYNITNISGDYRRDIDITASVDWQGKYDFYYTANDGDCAVDPQITVDNELKQIDLYINHDPYTVPDSLCVKFTIHNSAPTGNNTTVISTEIIGNLKMWTVMNITSLENVFVVDRSALELTAIAWKTPNGTSIGTQQPGAIARVRPGEYSSVGLTIYFNEDELSNLDWGGSGYFESNQMSVVFRADGRIVEVFSLRINLVWLP